MDYLASYLPKDEDGDGWTIDTLFGSPIDYTVQTVKDATPEVPDLNPFSWAQKGLETVGKYGQENVPYVAATTAAVGLGVAATGVVMLVGGGFLAYETLHLLGNSKNVGKAIKALDPSELAKAANPFTGGK